MKTNTNKQVKISISKHVDMDKKIDFNTFFFFFLSRPRSA